DTLLHTANFKHAKNCAIGCVQAALHTLNMLKIVQLAVCRPRTGCSRKRKEGLKLTQFVTLFCCFA
ncbi:MAG: hypothetical protein ABN478_07325, partial [Mixta sp.]